MSKLYKILLLLFLFTGNTFAQVNLKVVGGAYFKSSSATDLKLNGNINVDASSTLTQSGTGNISLSGNFTNLGTFNYGTGKVILFGTTNQTISSGTNASFYDLEVSNTGGNIQFADNTNLIISNNLTLSATNTANIQARNNRYVRVDGAISRLNIGHIDGNLRLNIASGNVANTIAYVGNGSGYTPIEIDINGTGGTVGYLNFISNTRTLDIAPSLINPLQNVEREYAISIPSGSTFDLAARTFDLVLHFLNPADIRNAADPLAFETAIWNGTVWGASLLSVGTRTTSSTQSIGNTLLGTYIIGPEAAFLTFYSRNSGAWSTASNWSLYEFGGAASSIAPRVQDIVHIGDEDVIDLDQNLATTSSSEIWVRKGGVGNLAGTLMLNQYVISGFGEFYLDDDGTLGIGSADGISQAPSATGSIQTAVREYNYLNHNAGNFIYTNTANAIVGNGLPSIINSLTLNSSSDLSLTMNLTINNDVDIQTGTLNLNSSIITSSGDFLISDGARIIIGGTNSMQDALVGFTSFTVADNSTFEFNGSNQMITNVTPTFSLATGFGNLELINAGDKTFAQNTRVRGNLINANTADMIVNTGINLQVEGEVQNSANILNSGNIEIGQ